MKVFLDTNVFAEYIFERNQFISVQRIFQAIENKEINALTSSATYYTLAYLSEQMLKHKGIHRPELTELVRKIVHSTVEEGVVHLVLQVLAIHHDENGGVVQGFGLAEFVGGVEHSERLARALGVPYHALRLVGLHYPIDNLVGGTQLLVTRHFLDDLIVVTLKHDEMLQDVEHALGLQQADDAELHLFEQLAVGQPLHIEVHQAVGFVLIDTAQLIFGVQQRIVVFVGDDRILPLIEIGRRCARNAVFAQSSVAGHAKEVTHEQFLAAAVVGLELPDTF